MKVLIESLQGQEISKLISSASELKLDIKSAEILGLCQMMSAECWSGYVGKVLICCWGLIPPSILSTQAYLWMHCTPAVRDHQFVLVRHSQRVIEKSLSRYSIITGHCHADAEDSIRWLRWLGATFGLPKDSLCEFVIRKKTNG